MGNKDKTIIEINISAIAPHEELETRLNYDGIHLDNLEASIKTGSKLPPILVIKSEVQSDKYHIVDGYYRMLVCKRLKEEFIEVEIFKENIRSAIIYRISKNAAHGLNYTLSERIQNTRKLLVDKDWKNWSNRKIARICGVNEKTVRNHRKILMKSGELPPANNPQLVNYFSNGRQQQMRVNTINQGRNSPTESSNIIIEDHQGYISKINGFIKNSNSIVISNKDIINNEKPIENPADLLQKQYQIESGDVIIAETEYDGKYNRKHVIVCGSSIAVNYEILLKRFAKEKAQMLFADPPYNVDYDSKKRTAKTTNHQLHKICNDNLASQEYQKLLESIFDNCSQYLDSGSMFLIWYGFKMTIETFTAITNTLGQCRQQIFWEKVNPRPDNSKFIWATESAITGWTGNNGASFKYAGKLPRNTFHSKDFIKSPHELPNGYHPCRKPVSITSRLIELCVEENGIVLDPFAGSGTVAVAAELCGRQSISIELEPAFVAIILWRFEKLGLKITRTNIEDLQIK